MLGCSYWLVVSEFVSQSRLAIIDEADVEAAPPFSGRVISSLEIAAFHEADDYEQVD